MRVRNVSVLDDAPHAHAYFSSSILRSNCNLAFGGMSGGAPLLP